MKGVTLNQREPARLQALNTVLEYQLPPAQAAETLGISGRQVRRVLEAHRRGGGRRPRSRQPGPQASQHSSPGHRISRGDPGRRAVCPLQPQPLPRDAGRTGGYSPEPSPQPPWPGRRQAAPASQAPGATGTDAPGGDAATHRWQPPPWLEDRGPRFVLLLAVDDAPARRRAPSSARRRTPGATSC